MTTDGKTVGLEWRTITAFMLPSTPGSEREAMERVAEAVRELRLPAARLERLKTAVAEAVLNAIAHDDHFQAELPVQVRVAVSDVKGAVSVCATNQGGGLVTMPQTPDLQAKFEGRQSPRGWGFFLIEKMVDKPKITSDEAHHTIELFLYQEGNQRRDEGI